jgi:hypothetical protein
VESSLSVGRGLCAVGGENVLSEADHAGLHMPGK